MSGREPQPPLPSRRSLRQHRRADSAAGAPAGEQSRATILELPASTVSPADVRSWTGPMPVAPAGAQDETPAETPVDEAVLPPGTRVDHDGVPVGPDGHPLSRRELRALRSRAAESAVESAPAPATTSRRAEAPAGAPGASGPVSRESLAAEGAALAARIGSGGDDPTAVDPELLREQERLAERARLLNTGMISRVPAPGESGAVVVPGVDAPTAAAPAAAEPTVDDAPAPATAPAAGSSPVAVAVGEPSREPVQAQSAHGLDSMGASAWSDRERRVILVAAAVVLVLLVALILVLVL